MLLAPNCLEWESPTHTTLGVAPHEMWPTEGHIIIGPHGPSISLAFARFPHSFALGKASPLPLSMLAFMANIDNGLS